MKPKLNRSPKTLFVAFVAASIDGRISLRQKSLPDWTSREDWRWLQRSLAKVDAVVVGRNTYLAAKSRLQKRTTFVFSGRLDKIERQGTVTFVNPQRVNLAKLFQPYRTVAVLGGGLVYTTMLARRLLDTLYVTIEPLVFGRGKEMFVGGTRTAHLRLISVRRLNRAGTLLLKYQVTR